MSTILAVTMVAFAFGTGCQWNITLLITNTFMKNMKKFEFFARRSFELRFCETT